jgi:hypothetical protein
MSISISVTCSTAIDIILNNQFDIETVGTDEGKQQPADAET